MKKTGFANALTVFSVIAIVVYVIVRVTLFLFAEYTAIEKIFAVMLICGELFILVHGLGYALNILKMQEKAKRQKINAAGLREEPSVAILVAARHEPKDVLENTFITLCNLNYKNKQIYFLDDSSDENYIQDADDLKSRCDISLFRRKERRGAKAGIINDCLKTLTQDYIAIFDADQNPLPDFLKAVIPLLENDEKLGFVQTPQFYSNIEGSMVARAAAFQQAVFYEYICEGKSAGDSMFCCGTNVVFRRKALVEAGGLDESTVTEDFATSVKLHAKGWRSLYFDHVYAFGMGPESLSGYFKQQFRWAVGTVSVFKQVLGRLFSDPLSLTFTQWWEYFLSSSYYLVGIAFFVMLICPVVYLLFKIPSFFANPEIYFLAFLPYIIFSMSVFYFILKDRNYRIRDLFLGQLLGEVTITVYMRAAVSAILGVKVGFGITEKTKTEAMPYWRLWPQLFLIFLTFISFIWGINRYIYEREPAILVNSFWVLYHCAFLSSIFYFNRKTE